MAKSSKAISSSSSSRRSRDYRERAKRALMSAFKRCAGSIDKFDLGGYNKVRACLPQTLTLARCLSDKAMFLKHVVAPTLHRYDLPAFSQPFLERGKRLHRYWQTKLAKCTTLQQFIDCLPHNLRTSFDKKKQAALFSSSLTPQLAADKTPLRVLVEYDLGLRRADLLVITPYWVCVIEIKTCTALRGLSVCTKLQHEKQLAHTTALVRKHLTGDHHHHHHDSSSDDGGSNSGKCTLASYLFYIGVTHRQFKLKRLSCLQRAVCLCSKMYKVHELRNIDKTKRVLFQCLIDMNKQQRNPQ